MKQFFWTFLSNLIALDSASTNMINNKSPNADPSRNPTWTRKPTTSSLFIHYRMILTNHSCRPSFVKPHHTTSLVTWSKTFSKSADAKYNFFFFAKCFSCHCLKIIMGFVFLHPGMKPSSISSMSTCCLMNSLINFRNLIC